MQLDLSIPDQSLLQICHSHSYGNLHSSNSPYQRTLDTKNKNFTSWSIAIHTAPTDKTIIHALRIGSDKGKSKGASPLTSALAVLVELGLLRPSYGGRRVGRWWSSVRASCLGRRTCSALPTEQEAIDGGDLETEQEEAEAALKHHPPCSPTPMLIRPAATSRRAAAPPVTTSPLRHAADPAGRPRRCRFHPWTATELRDKSAQTTAIPRRRSLAAAASGNRSAPVCTRLKSRGSNEETGNV
jgi:hypothetical protein